MRERIIRIGILTVIFILALNIFSYLTNRGNADMTADMGSATLPTISFTASNSEINLLTGHVNEMDIPAMRDTITPLDKTGSISGNIQTYDAEINSLSYEVYTLDGEKKLFEKSQKEVGKSVLFQIGDTLDENEEGVLKITLHLGKNEKAHYYTRIIHSEELYLEECLNYVKTVHTNMLEKKNTDDLKKIIESNELGDNTTLQHVTIHSDLEHVTWGDLEPEIIGQVRYDIQETKMAYTSVLLRYRVKCAGDNNAEEFFDIKEFFKVRHIDGKNYLLTYDRTMNEVFDGSNVVLTSKGINLGLTTEDAQYKVNQEGTIVSFVQNNELWSYRKEEDEFALVFSFADSEKEDIRNYLNYHSLKILSMEENGNITFGVYGYMNRGPHEGESGVAIYYFRLAQNTVEEKAFIPSNQSQMMIKEGLGELAYYNNEKNVLYVLAEGILYKVDLGTGKREILLEGLEKDQYVSSDDGRFMAYQKNEEGTEIEVLNFQKDSIQKVEAKEGELIQPLGFVLGDFVYGVSKPEYAGKTSLGEVVTAMHKIEIRDSKNEVVKTYHVEGTFILDVLVESNMITLERAVKSGDFYSEISEDYITNNEESANSVTLQSYWTNLKETQFRLVFEDGIKNKKAKVLKPKQVLFERETTMEFEHNSDGNFYSVYSLGEMAGLYEEAGDAVQKAKETSGVVLSPGQKYVWEDGNHVSWYRNFEMDSFNAKTGESTLETCVREVLAYEGQSVDVVSEMQSKTVFEVLNENVKGEAIQFRDCSSKDMFYLINKGIPVIALTDSSNAIVLIGYDAKSVTYIDPGSGSIRNRKIEVIDQMTEASGNTFFGYVN